MSYGELAAEIGKPSASRAVGLANGRNPISIIVPCHRVVGSGGDLTGYGGGLERKRYLLDFERRRAATATVPATATPALPATATHATATHATATHATATYATAGTAPLF
jgi:methylated-DNA-[protein]-cysteine S-methyltransferase